LPWAITFKKVRTKQKGSVKRKNLEQPILRKSLKCNIQNTGWFQIKTEATQAVDQIGREHTHDSYRH